MPVLVGRLQLIVYKNKQPEEEKNYFFDYDDQCGGSKR
jgi:hypothetical protein